MLLQFPLMEQEEKEEEEEEDCNKHNANKNGIFN